MHIKTYFYYKNIYPKLNDKCIFCLERIDNDYCYVYCNKCLGIFHKKCMDEWIINNNQEIICPLCRNNVFTIFWDYLNKFLKFVF